MRGQRTAPPGPGGVGDGLPSLPTGEPVLHRWFVILMLLLVPAGIAVTAWALTSFGRPEVDAAARRPPGVEGETHDRGEAILNQDTTTTPGPACFADVGLRGDASARAALARAAGSACLLLERPRFDTARVGLERLAVQNGLLRMAVFELTGVDSSARVDDGRPIIELNAKFQFEDATRAAPAIIHELTHLGQDLVPTPVVAADELVAVEAQRAACELLTFGDDPPRGCRDAAELLDSERPIEELEGAGYPLLPRRGGWR
ncbi:MAG: hypothetical protein KY469_17605 [Actinobacteria bacterium]|nr:hypothetical protein [Actinomycetota bacterium]